jgi:hypothetical protein
MKSIAYNIDVVTLLPGSGVTRSHVNALSKAVFTLNTGPCSLSAKRSPGLPVHGGAVLATVCLL